MESDKKKHTYFLSKNFKIMKKLSTHKNKTTYLLKSKADLSKHYIAKQFTINDPEEYLEVEHLLGALIDLNTSSIQAMAPMVDYHTRNLTDSVNELILIYDKYEYSLEEQMRVLGKKIKIDKEMIIKLIKDICHAISGIHDKNLLYLGLKPENIMFSEAQGKYYIGDPIFNSVSLKLLEHKRLGKEKQKFEDFPELKGKKEHNVCIFDGGFDTKTKTVQIKRLKRDKVLQRTPYEAPEIVREGFDPSDFSDNVTKADVFSVGDFGLIEKLNIAKNPPAYNKVLCSAITIAEKSGFGSDITSLLVQMLALDQAERIHLDKAIPLLNHEDDTALMSKTIEYQGQSYQPEKYITPKCGYLKPNVVRGHLQINSMNDLIKFARSRDEKVLKLSLFFFNEHLKDNEIKQLAANIQQLEDLESLVADFGNYPMITDNGFSYFIDSISKFQLKSLSLSLGTSVSSRSVNITDSMIKYLCTYIKKMKNLKILKINLRNRVSISSNSLFYLKDCLSKKFSLKKLDLYLDGTLVDPILCKKFETEMKRQVDKVLISF